MVYEAQSARFQAIAVENDAGPSRGASGWGGLISAFGPLWCARSRAGAQTAPRYQPHPGTENI